jgi:hypothetical protein
MPTEPDDALWTGRDADPEIAQLTQVLRPLRYRAQPLPARCYPPPPRRSRWPLALAASVAAALIGLGSAMAWRLSWPEGAAWAGRIVPAARPASSIALKPGVDFTAPADAHAEFAIARLGTLRLAPGSTLRLLESRSGEHRARLVEGSLSARVWAPPGAFGVEIGATQAIDLGCVFTLSRNRDGHGELTVDSGWVLLSGTRDTLVPAGARADIDAGRGPGTAHRQEAAPELRAALARIDAAEGAVAPAGAEVAAVLTASTDADALSLVSLLSRYPTLAEGPLLARAQAALPQAPPVDLGRLRAGDATALDGLWDALPYPRAKSWWLHWRDAFAAPG